MSDKHSYDRILPLIHKYIKGDCSLVESEHLENWVNEHPENKQFFVQIKESWAYAQMIQKPIKAKTKSWSELMEKADKQSLPGKSRVIQLFDRRSIMKIAASLLIVAASIFLFNQLKNDGSYQFDANTMMAEVTLPDQSEVILSDQSSISFKKDDEGNRHVDLKGSAFFSVAHDSLAPFKIHNENALITVLGTSFFVDNISKSNKTIVSVASGSVSVEVSGNLEILKVNDVVSIDRTKGELIKSKVTDQNFRFFKTKTLSFEDVRFEEVIHQVNVYYGSNIKIDPNLSDCKLTAVYKNQSLESLLKVLGKTFSIEFTEKAGGIYLSGSC